MLDTSLRSAKDSALQSVAARMESVSPGAVSWAGLTAGLATAGLVVAQLYWWGLLAWWLNRVLDGLDGTLARVHGRQSDWGGYLDMVLDLSVYAVVLVSFLWGGSKLVLGLGAIVLALFYVNIGQLFLSSAILEKIKHQPGAAARRRQVGTNGRLTTLELPTTLVEGAETVVLYSLLFVFVGQLPVVLGLMILAMAITIGQRFSWAWRTLAGGTDRTGTDVSGSASTATGKTGPTRTL
ncbi:MAG: hypothetical protein COU69_01440 [Candidatus Pacebacteria bacterium CG10_big_fil_rev_8_21_14_0_10_56_10]|nr:MAG: hypothetical protein COU69_01440 [Candidatus Pacebacteria bacterium CG10_big_fil_rev_8_21_14_0_10_56_10]